LQLEHDFSVGPHQLIQFLKSKLQQGSGDEVGDVDGVNVGFSNGEVEGEDEGELESC